MLHVIWIVRKPPECIIGTATINYIKISNRLTLVRRSLSAMLTAVFMFIHTAAVGAVRWDGGAGV